MGITREKVTPMYANHTDMCRFTGRADRNYEMVASEIQQLCRKVCHEPCTSLGET